MPLKKSHGNMYVWLSHMHSFLAGECPHKCKYCYVNQTRARLAGRTDRFTGPTRLIEDEFKTRYTGKPKTIFIEHQQDLFAASVPSEWIVRVLDHCLKFPENTFVLQTKNPIRYSEFLTNMPDFKAAAEAGKFIFGTTIESNRTFPGMSEAPLPEERMMAMETLPYKKFLTLEPILDFDVAVLASWVARVKPTFLNLGADSKNNGLPEPTREKIFQLVDELKKYGIDLREKANLERLKA